MSTFSDSLGSNWVQPSVCNEYFNSLTQAKDPPGIDIDKMFCNEIEGLVEDYVSDSDSSDEDTFNRCEECSPGLVSDSDSSDEDTFNRCEECSPGLDVPVPEISNCYISSLKMGEFKQIGAIRVLILFSGTNSVGKALEKLLPEGSTILNIDNSPKAVKAINADVLDWDYKAFPPKYFDIIWGSPPCTNFSFAK